MFQIFRGQVRGIGPDSELDIFFKVGVRFREHLGEFRGAKLHVFMSILLHAGADGWAEVSVRRMQEESGYGKDAIHTALRELCELEIEGSRVLLRESGRDKGGTFAPNRYLLFPTPEEVARYEGATKELDSKPYRYKPDTVQPDTVQPDTENADTREINTSYSLSESKDATRKKRKRGSRSRKEEAPDQLALSGLALPPPEPKPDTKALFGEICRTLGYDSKLLTEKDRGVVIGLSSRLREHVGPEEFEAFREWYWADNWRLEREAFPTPSNLLTWIGKWRAAGELASPGADDIESTSGMSFLNM